MEEYLMKIDNQRDVLLSREWANQTPSKAGLYVGFEDGRIVYIGESGNIQERMKDLLDSRHHNLRRNIGRFNFSKLDGYIDATSYNKFPPNIEEKVNSWLKQKIKISVLPTNIGRRELEERLIEKFHPKYNQKEKRKNN
jgi:excinuclease UvrABC nuclease subunit